MTQAEGQGARSTEGRVPTCAHVSVQGNVGLHMCYVQERHQKGKVTPSEHTSVFGWGYEDGEREMGK